ncbi:hypothetical protein ACFX15_010367 [Malus domestica]|uniref:Uncharacterized protein n=1 Tax=Malus domestica TaxID=3750 RepID=A0A498IKM9_MALDO|nr:uncharacterized protein LOC114820049 [Malus domestica]XP_050113526.1 uncharacterized protein LOC126591865 [Malus sylvestris]RXH82607.1 hypothetical protein DVH24_036948 [Malus domestica]
MNSNSKPNGANLRGGTRRRVPGMPLINGGRKDDRYHDQDLILFQELQKREKECNIVSLLQPVSDEFELNGNYQLYRIASAKKGSEIFAENDKNDYDWLKTPPATPLFPSLEMDTNGPELVVQREIPIFQPLSRFAGSNCNIEAVEPRNGRPKSPNPKPKIPVRRSVTPSQRRSICSSTGTIVSSKAQTKNRTTPIGVDPRPNQKPATNANIIRSSASVDTRAKRSANNNAVGETSAPIDFLSSSGMAMGLGGVLKMEYSKTKPTTSTTTTTCVSAASPDPLIVARFSNEKPDSVRTEQRSTSATRGGRGRTSTMPTHLIPTKAAAPETASKPIRRQSCSPSVCRGRKVLERTMQVQEITTTATTTIALHGSLNSTPSLKGRIQTGNNGTQVLGSRIVQRVMNARKAVTHHEEIKDHKKTQCAVSD